MTVGSVSPSQTVTRESNLTRIVAGSALGVLSAVLLILAFQPYSIWPLAFFAFVPFLLAENRILPLRWAGLARGIGIGGWLAVLLASIFGFGSTATLFFFIAILIAAIAIVAAPGVRRFHVRTDYRWFILQGAVDAAGIELIRSFIPLINTHAFWAQTAYSQPWLIQPLAFFGVYGLTLVWMFVNYGIALVVIAWFDGRWCWDDIRAVSRRFALRWLAVALTVFAVWIGISLVTLATASAESPTVHVATVQHGFPKAGHMDLETEDARLDALMKQTRLAASDGAQLIVWPELAVGFDPQVKHTDVLQALSTETGAHILIGYGIVTVEDDWRNEAVMIAPDGSFYDVYGKNYATKPGEPNVVTAGSYPVFDTPLGKLATIICNDVNFPSATQTLARNGAQLVTLPTLETSAPGLGWEQRTQAVLRAVESRIAVVKADAAGIHMIVDPHGRILAQTTMSEGEAGYLAGVVPLGTGNTPTTYLGSWVGWIALIAVIAFTIVINRKPRHKSKQ